MSTLTADVDEHRTTTGVLKSNRKPIKEKDDFTTMTIEIKPRLPKINEQWKDTLAKWESIYTELGDVIDEIGMKSEIGTELEKDYQETKKIFDKYIILAKGGGVIAAPITKRGMIMQILAKGKYNPTEAEQIAGRFGNTTSLATKADESGVLQSLKETANLQTKDLQKNYARKAELQQLLINLYHQIPQDMIDPLLKRIFHLNPNGEWKGPIGQSTAGDHLGLEPTRKPRKPRAKKSTTAKKSAAGKKGGAKGKGKAKKSKKE